MDIAKYLGLIFWSSCCLHLIEFLIKIHRSIQNHFPCPYKLFPLTIRSFMSLSLGFLIYFFHACIIHEVLGWTQDLNSLLRLGEFWLCVNRTVCTIFRYERCVPGCDRLLIPVRCFYTLWEIYIRIVTINISLTF